MDEQFEEILNKTAAYVQESQTEIGNLQSELQKQAEEKQAFNLQAQRTAAVLCDRGYLRPEKVNEFVDKIASDPLSVLEHLPKMAKLIQANSLGGPSSVKQANAGDPNAKVCEFEKVYFPELHQGVNSGMVD